MKVCLINTLYAPHADGGAERSVRYLAEGLQRAGIQAVVIRCGSEGAQYEVDGVRVVCLPIPNLYWPFRGPHRSLLTRSLWHAIDSYNPRAAQGVRQVLEREKPDVVHSNILAGLSVSVWTAAREAGAAVVHTLRDYYLLCPRSSMYRAGGNCGKQCGGCKLYGLPRQRASSAVDQVVGVSGFILRRHIENGYFPGVPGNVIHSGYQGPRELPSRQRSPGAFRIGFLGRIAATKGIERVIDAVKASRYAARLVLRIAGGGDPGYVARLKAASAGIRTEFLGVVRAEAFLNDVDILVVPSTYHDPLPRVVIEAYANGVPVLAARRGGLPELVEHGVTGHLFDPDAPGDLLRELDSMLARMEVEPQRLERLRQRAFERARAFDPERITAQYVAVYAAALQARREKAA